jgi:hypothetical protein
MSCGIERAEKYYDRKCLMIYNMYQITNYVQLVIILTTDEMFDQ